MLVIYGRRRIGKTFLVDESLKGRITFRHAGLSPVEKNGKNSLKAQLKHFHTSLKLHGCTDSKAPQSWFDAFYLLAQFLQSNDTGERQVVFLDELPWMDTPRSGFVTAFEGFWNTWACHRSNFMLVVCGSANSWMLDNLIDSRGGLYGRATYEIRLAPFNLAECREFYQSRGIMMSPYDMVQCYMVLGGIPFYLNYLKKELSLAQNISALFWGKSPRLRDEYQRLFSSIFDSPDEIMRIVKLLSKRQMGYNRTSIAEELRLTSGTMLSKRLKALVASDFVSEYVPFGHSKKDVHYKLTDPFCLFCLRFVVGNSSDDDDYWTSICTSASCTSWKGIAFEGVCFSHIKQIKAALGIGGVSSQVSQWSTHGEGGDRGAQVDMLISRNDNVVNMCEMKFYSNEFIVDKDYEATIRHRISLLSELLPKRYAIHPTAITTYGIKRNQYSDIFIRQLTIDALFTTIVG